MRSLSVSILTSVLALGLGATMTAEAAEAGTDMRIGSMQMAQSSPAAEDIFWQSIQGSTDPAMFQAYLDQVTKGTFPGTYKALAEIKINTLSKGAPAQPPAASQPAPAATQTQPVQAAPAQTVSAPEIEACDRAASQPQDDQRPPNIPGVTFDALDTSSAIQACLKASKLEGAPARVFFQLGRAYDKSGDIKDSTDSYRKAAEMGHPRASYNLAITYMKGRGGIRKDPGLALTLLDKAHDQKVTAALTGLGDYYSSGAGGRRDYAKAVDYYSQAVSAGEASGYGGLGVMTYNGTGTARSKSKACEIWQQGAQMGDDTSSKNIKRLCKFR